MRQQLRQRPPAPQEQRENIQYSRRNDYQEEARAYFEHLIAEVNEASDWNWAFKSNGTKDAQDLADESLQAEPAVEVDNEQALLSVSSPSNPAPYDTDERASSPLADDLYTHGMRVLKERAPALGLMSIDELKATRRLLSGGSAEEVKLSKGLKDVLRFYGKSGHLGGPVGQSEVQSVVQPLLSTSMISGSLNLSHTEALKTPHSIDDSSNEEDVVDGKRRDQGEDECSEENDKEEEQWMEKALIETQHREDGDEEDEEEEDEPLLRHYRGEIFAHVVEEEEVTADYSNY
ncbi:hypothetical protein BGX29_004655, partial [Mortierella sp. GBA35]